jgi:uncharacterized membrane protein
VTPEELDAIEEQYKWNSVINSLIVALRDAWASEDSLAEALDRVRAVLDTDAFRHEPALRAIVRAAIEGEK